MAYLLSTVSGFFTPLWELAWTLITLVWEALAPLLGKRAANTGSASPGSKKSRRQRRRAAATAEQQAGGAPAVTAPQAKAGHRAAPPAESPAESDEEGEAEEAGAFPTEALPSQFAAADEGDWEPVRTKGKPSKAGGVAAGAGAGVGSRAAAAAGAAAQIQKRGVLRTCERPDCGAQGRGYKKCGRCATGISSEEHHAALLACCCYVAALIL